MSKYNTYEISLFKELIDLLSAAEQKYELANERADSLIKHNQKLDKALDKAVSLLDRNMLCKKCPFPHVTERCTVNGCREYMKECLLNYD